MTVGRVVLGRSGLDVSRLAFGTGTDGVSGTSQQAGLGSDLTQLLLRAYEAGVTFWDTADQYGTHAHLCAALSCVPRDDITVLTKTRATTAAELDADVARFHRELGVRHLDVLLLHCMRDAEWTSRLEDVITRLTERKQAGDVRSIGVSCHAHSALEAVANEGWVDVLLARANPAGIRVDGDVRAACEAITRAGETGMGTIAMKVLGCGALARDGHTAVRFAFEHAHVDAITIGISDEWQLAQCVSWVEAFEVA